MNANPSNIPQLSGAAGLESPGFDILLAVSAARQAALPTVRMLKAQATRAVHAERVNALSHFLAAAPAATEQDAVRPVRFFDLSDEANDLPETMNSLFTRGFQPMLNSADIEPWGSVQPIPHDEDNME
ncbi:MAG: hypothetical protein JNM03_03690 [Sphingopyxis sp.]|uniref:hypothetical protein n=1 Tax=Sphingopyxis sp. TaxID=1908224 RepID=UPI001A599CD6|nr:hypothetical protein [Sphingopyxis sp.]MBL9069071.1 hypothetical protein [Sphingopyxis sp.]